MRRALAALLILALAGCASAGRTAADPSPRPEVLDLWTRGMPAFGVFAPNENPRRPGEPAPTGPSYTMAGAQRLAANPLYDLVFLNLEGRYEREAVEAMVQALRGPQAVGRKALLVRIPSIEGDGAETTRARVLEVLAMGADGVTIPHVRNVEEARLAISFFRDAGVDVWTPANRRGDKIAMLMLEDPGAVAEARAIADLPGYSVLATGIGSLRGALGGDAAGAEAGTQRVLAETRRTGLVNMLTANTRDVEQRVREGFLGLLMQGPEADEAIRIGRAAAGR